MNAKEHLIIGILTGGVIIIGVNQKLYIVTIIK